MTATLTQQIAYIRLLQQIANNKEQAWFRLLNGETETIIEGDPSEQVILQSIEKSLLILDGRDKKMAAIADNILHGTLAVSHCLVCSPWMINAIPAAGVPPDCICNCGVRQEIEKLALGYAIHYYSPSGGEIFPLSIKPCPSSQ